MFIICLLLVFSLTILLYSTEKELQTRRIFSKITTSILFIAIALYGYFTKDTNTSYFIYILIGLCFALIGDIFLVFNKDNGRLFILGLLSFCITHAFYYIAFNTLSSFSFIHFISSIIFATIIVIFMKLMSFLEFKSLFKLIAFYSYIISFMLFKSMELYDLNNKFSNLVIIGTILFTISDMVLCFVLFYKRCPKYMESINLTTYYIGQMLIALSIGFI